MTETDICNMALSFIGKGTIMSKEAENENARACKLFYDQTRKEVLRAFPWGFAYRIERLAVVDITVPGYAYIYAYPDSCLLAYKLRSEEPNRERREPYKVINIATSTKAICCDVENAYLEYLLDVKDPDIMDSLFIQAFSHLLAANIAMRMTGNPQQHTLQYQLFQASLQQAQLQDAREMKTEITYLSNYAKARFGKI